jgi:hypothetical protein
MKFNFDCKDKFGLILELIASTLTLLALNFGTTTLIGTCYYGGSLIFWWLLLLRKQLWGLIPLNVVSVILIGINLASYI